MKIRYTLAVACALAMTVATTAQAALITYNFGGTLNVVDPELSSLAAVGDTFTGSFSIESTATNQWPSNAYYGDYVDGFAINATVNGQTYVGYSGGGVSVFHHPFDPTSSEIFAAASWYQGGTVTGPSVGGLSPTSVEMQLANSHQHVFSSTALPTNLTLSSFEQSNFRLYFNNFNTSAYGRLTYLAQLTATPVPEASTSAMLALGLGALAFVRRRQAS